MTKKQIITLIVIFALLAALPLLILLTRRNQDIRNRAAGTNEIRLVFNPASGIKAHGESFIVEPRLYKNPEITGAREINVSGVQATVTVSDKFTINSASCLSPFTGLKIARINGQTITFMCAIAIDATPVSTTNLGFGYANINLTVKNDSSGEAAISYTATRVTEAGITGQAPDVSNAGQNAAFTISEIIPTINLSVSPSTTSVVSPSISPNPSITPTIATTITPIPTAANCSQEGGPCGVGFAGPSHPLGTCCNGLSCVESNMPDAGGTCQGKSPPPPPIDCPSHQFGDANCDGIINDADYRIWEWDTQFPDLPYKRADFFQDGREDLIDFEIWRRNSQGEDICTNSDKTVSMTYEKAKKIAEYSICISEGIIRDEGREYCNNNTGTWWLPFASLSHSKPGCFPSCVVDIASKSADINWSCMGLITPSPF